MASHSHSHSHPINYKIDHEISIDDINPIQVFLSYNEIPILISKKPKKKFLVNIIEVDLSIHNKPSCLPKIVIIGFDNKIKN